MIQKILLPIIGVIALVNSFTVTLQELPAGDYYYTAKEENRSSLFIRKGGLTVIGLEQTVSPSCFRGMVKENKIVNVTRIDFPDNAASEWNYTEGEVYDLDHYWVNKNVESPKSLLTCLKVFWRGNLPLKLSHNSVLSIGR